MNELTIEHADSWRMTYHHEHTCQTTIRKTQERATGSNVAIVAVSPCFATGIIMVDRCPLNLFIVQNV
jgi:hypothetical protein